MKKIRILLVIIGIYALVTSCNQMKERVDLVVYNATIYTVNNQFETVKAIAIKDGKFVDLGSNEYILEKYTADKTYNGIGKFIYPGFIDGHCHYYAYGIGLQKNADLRGTKSQEEIIERLKAFHKDHPFEWVTGRSWDQNDWEVQEFPTKKIIDEAFPDNPVVLRRVDGHAAWLNSEALRRAGITTETKIEGGDIILKDGELTGILIDNAISLVNVIIPPPDKSMNTQALFDAQKKCFEVGLTSVVDCGLSFGLINLIDNLNKEGSLKMRINAMLSPTEANFDGFVKKGIYVTDYLSVRSIKVYADGALGSRGALMLEDYSDDPGNKGLQIAEKDYYRQICQLAYENNYQMSIHAIGDAANRLSLEIFGETLKEKNDKRWRIEHSQIIHPDDFDLFKNYSIIPSVQPTHCTSDMYWAGDRVGAERIKGAYAYKQLLATNNWLISGTDFPVEKIDPLLTFYASVARKDAEGWPKGGFQMENALSREETLKSMTIWAAKGSFEENVKGSIEIGKFADFVILEKDLMTQSEDEILKNFVVATFSNGEEVYNVKNSKTL